MLLYVANCSRQTQAISYRLEFNRDGTSKKTSRSRRTSPIPSGKQAVIHGNITTEERDAIVDQLSKYGMVGEANIGGMPNKVVPFIYSEDKPVRTSSILSVVAHNKGIQTGEGRSRREAAAIGAATAAEKAAVESAEEMKGFQMEIEQEEQPTDPDQSRLDEGFRLERDERKLPKERRKR